MPTLWKSRVNCKQIPAFARALRPPWLCCRHFEGLTRRLKKGSPPKGPGLRCRIPAIPLRVAAVSRRSRRRESPRRPSRKGNVHKYRRIFFKSRICISAISNMFQKVREKKEKKKIGRIADILSQQTVTFVIDNLKSMHTL